jgi:putative addiction module component (TIGR02574 family)
VRRWPVHGFRAKLDLVGSEAEDLMDRVLALPEEDRREFARRLLGKLAPDPEVLEAWYDEVEARWGELERGETETASWADVRQRVFATR